MMMSFGDTVRDGGGFLGTSVWRSLSGDGEFVRMTAYESVAALDASYESMLASGFLERAVQRYGVAPDVTRCLPVYSASGFAFGAGEDAAGYLTLSMRAMDLGEGPAWVEKLKYNFTEISLIPGFSGCWIGVTDDVPDEVTGLALWQTEGSARSSIPDSPHYEIKVFGRYR